jgi:DHA2 family multidrug resistance protein
MDGGTTASTGTDSRRAWLAIAAGTLGGFMALLDTSIVNSSLPVIQGEIGATRSEATWVGTAYLMTEIIILPLTAWIERMLGMRRFLLWSAILFTLFSILCGSASNLGMIIVGRLGQGLSGGMMIPSAYSMGGRLLPPEQQSRAVAIITGPILVAPIIGPVVGGWLTEQFNWHYAFFINVPFSAILVVLTYFALEDSPIDLREIADADWLGIAGVTTLLGCLVVILEEGHNEQWFESALIWRLAFGAAIGLGLLFAGQARARRPVIRLALLRNRVICLATAIIFLSGFTMFSLFFLTPQFLAAIAGYNALQAGLVVFASGISSCATMFVYPMVVKHCNLKAIVCVAAVTLAGSCAIAAGFSAQASGGEFLPLLFAVGVGVALTALPMQQTAIAMAPPGEVPEVTSIATIARNFGGSVGLAALSSFQEARLDFHHWRLAETLGGNDPGVADTVRQWATTFGGGPEANDAALQTIDSHVLLDALVMTFGDSFFLLAIIAMVMVPIALFLPSRLPEGSAGAAMH